MKLGLIFARARNGVIGKDGGLPWHLPEDLAHFKRVTMGCPVIMGRKTWDSLPERFRPLPGRTNIVVTRQADWHAAGAARAASLEDAVGAVRRPAARLGDRRRAVVRLQALPLADLAEVTEIDADFDGDVHAPVLGAHWRELAREPHRSAQGLPFAFVTYRKAEPAAP